ncbi:helix-turn-helix domain-containing protein [Curtobacterium pusillum]|uniref:Helix-turn-helix domain-containing protein n=1 Tax=Curtobacterium pusillum TaxID=69373 RepID=A0ABX2M4B4_9MICO|nr:helix-turn-helix domain-containing protein [Curtobacterium pusillum]NUU12721.1 helix-turn-helix domain-containing protein [Curtobacterium pusillum]
MTPAEVADLLRVKPNTLEKWRSRGRGPAFVKDGRLIRYHPRAVDAWLRACEHGGQHGRG